MTISLHRYGGADGGEAWFDDLQLARVMPPADRGVPDLSELRGLLPMTGQARFGFVSG